MWAVAVCGAFLIVLSTVIGAVMMKKVDSDIQLNSRKIDKLRDEIQRGWDTHKRADQQDMLAKIYTSLNQIALSPPDFLIDWASRRFKDAIAGLWISTGNEDETKWKAIDSRADHLINSWQRGGSQGMG